jgi:hypothetical protein
LENPGDDPGSRLLRYPFQKQERIAMTPKTENPPRKPYTAPQLLVYGDIREITKNSSSKGKDSSGAKDTGSGTGGD